MTDLLYAAFIIAMLCLIFLAIGDILTMVFWPVCAYIGSHIWIWLDGQWQVAEELHRRLRAGKELYDND